ncbi:ABC transporter ATP-binding protein [Candidatus Protochlamydia phocaeensis]|uniref:ABC transporter ATP-binding protein n=1 Tax=Candidatus Protochlamydia phocaeensis TaxID=1414722 RepID=UPI00083893B2|nr:ATP-binding cassette domain-containing protein [Candidatus Protochlamydia phocaeensis]
MSIIAVEALWKEFYIPKRKKGFLGNFASLFSREYIVKTALDRISFTIEEGELVGYIGPNGAGKSTTVKILSGILVPNGGSVKVMGKTPWDYRIETVSQLGVVFGQRTQLWWDLPVIESFELLRDIYRVPADVYRKTLESLTDTLELSKLCHIPVRQLSLGQRMRCDIAASLLHSPKILFLDEPTIGLDAVSKLAVRDFIRHLNKERQVTIMLTTHDMDDIESLCNRVLILNEGRLFLDGSLEALRQKLLPERRLIVDLLHEHETIRDPQAAFFKQEGHRVWLSFNPVETSTPELIRRITASHAIRDLYIENPPIEEIIAKLYRDVNL